MQWQVHHKKSQSAIVGTIIFIIAAFIIAGVMLSLINYNQDVLTTQKNSIQVQQMASLMEKDILAYYNYTNNKIYINVSSMAYPYSYYISGISIILKNGSYITFDQYSRVSNILNVIVKYANGNQKNYNYLPVSMNPNSSALIIINNINSNPLGISISVVNGKSIAVIPVENLQQLISSLIARGVVNVVPPTKVVYNKYFNVTFSIISMIWYQGIPPSYSNSTWSVSMYYQTLSSYVLIKGNSYYAPNITFSNVPSGYYYYYNVSNIIFPGKNNYYICYPDPPSGIILVNQNTLVNITYNCYHFG
jgi:hypothetical protein